MRQTLQSMDKTYMAFASLADMINTNSISERKLISTIWDLYHTHMSILNQDSAMLRVLLDLCYPQNGGFMANMIVEDRKRLLNLKKKLKENIQIQERPKWLQCDPKTVLPGLTSSRQIAL